MFVYQSYSNWETKTKGLMKGRVLYEKMGILINQFIVIRINGM